MQVLDGGRVNQKARTRTTLLAAALQMIRDGRQPTVEEVAQATGISKRTAYRYFSSREHLLADAALEGLRPRLAEGLTNVGHDVEERVASLASELHDLTIRYEPELRTMARVALDSAPAATGKRPAGSRGTRRVEWIEEALKPARSKLPKAAYERLVSALSVCLGIDSFLILRDIRGHSEAEIKNVVTWMCRAVLDATLAQTKTR